MDEAKYNSQIEKIASLITQDKTPLDEQDPRKLKKYYDFAKENYSLEGEAIEQLVNEAFLYLKLKTAKDVDPIKEGDKYGAGFS